MKISKALVVFVSMMSLSAIADDYSCGPVGTRPFLEMLKPGTYKCANGHDLSIQPIEGGYIQLMPPKGYAVARFVNPSHIVSLFRTSNELNVTSITNTSNLGKVTDTISIKKKANGDIVVRGFSDWDPNDYVCEIKGEATADFSSTFTESH